MSLHIYAPQPDRHGLVYQRCPTCERNTHMLWFHVEWYGVDVTCPHCGERWQDGERLERPFAPGWRRDSIESAKRRWTRV
jgi:hypothetical protein